MSMGKIMVADDDTNICELLRLYLEKEGYETQVSRDGGTAVEQFHAFQPDLVLLDIMLPVMDGWAVCAKIRETSPGPPSSCSPPRARIRIRCWG